MLDVNISSIILQMYFTEQYVATKNGQKLKIWPLIIFLFFKGLSSCKNFPKYSYRIFQVNST